MAKKATGRDRPRKHNNSANQTSQKAATNNVSHGCAPLLPADDAAVAFGFLIFDALINTKRYSRASSGFDRFWGLSL